MKFCVSLCKAAVDILAPSLGSVVGRALRGLPFLVAAAPGFAQDSLTQSDRYSFHGYATVNYYKFDWDTDPGRRAQVDLERFALEPSYQANDWLRFQGEIEFEHGGTGAAMELDKFEESGEYESEVEKGGEVQIEELCAVATFNPRFGIKLGHMFVPVGYAYVLDEPAEYFTVRRSEAEAGLLPQLWHETGAEIFGSAGPIDYRFLVVNGLDATGFSSGNWVAGGHQGRFETVNAEDLAWAGRLDWRVSRRALIGVSGYYGNSADNRPKPDLDVPAYVTILEAHGEWRYRRLLMRGLFLYGTLQNSGAVSAANRALSSALEVKRTPVGKTAVGSFLEAGCDVLAGLTVFGRYDYYDTQREMDANFFNNPRWERKTLTGGIDYAPDKRLVLKGEYSHRALGLPTGNVEDTYAFGMGLFF